MSSGRFIDRPKAEQESEIFRQYLEKHCVLEALTKALAALKLQKVPPPNPMAFVVKELGGAVPNVVIGPAWEAALKEALAEKNKLLKRVQELEDKIKEYEDKAKK